MFRVICGLLSAALLLVGAGAARAATPAEIVAGCQPGGAFGQTFGAARMVGAPLRPSSPFPFPAYAAPSNLAPFSIMELHLARMSRKVTAVDLWAIYPTAREAEAAIGPLEAAIVASGRFPVQGHLTTVEMGGVTYSNQRDDSDLPGRLSIEVIWRGNRLLVSCSDGDGVMADIRASNWRDTANRPTAPEGPDVPAAPPAVICGSAQSRKAFLAGLDLGRIGERAMDYFSQATVYSDQLISWHEALMSQSGPWTAEDGNRYIWTDRLYSLQRTSASARPIFGLLGLAGDAFDAGNDAAACRSAVQALRKIGELERDFLTYWAAIDEAYAAARARGVPPA